MLVFSSDRDIIMQEAHIYSPVVWKDDPECGHIVTCAFQTHYCTYIRVPRLLTLQPSSTLNELLLMTMFQWFELWLKVLLVDMRGVLADKGKTHESIKLLRRGVELFRLFDVEFDFGEHTLIREVGATKTLRLEPALGFSPQQNELAKLARRLTTLTGNDTLLDNAIADYTDRFLQYRRRFAHLTKNTLVARKKGVPRYAHWISLPDLLDLQQGVKASWTEIDSLPTSHAPAEAMTPDETMFVIVHQCFELWFQVILDHIDSSIVLLKSDKVAGATRLVRRAVDIERMLVQQIQIPATMNLLDFARFRHETRRQDGKLQERGLSPASGTESYQFREIEITAGLRDDPVFVNYLAGSEKLPIRLLTLRQSDRQTRDSMPVAFADAVRRRGIEKLDDIFRPSNVHNPNADLEELADTLIAFDEVFRFWRLAHVSMVEKMIGGKSGTGFLGPEYLMETAGIRIQEKNRIFADKQVRPRFFEELWQVRTRLGTP